MTDEVHPSLTGVRRNPTIEDWARAEARQRIVELWVLETNRVGGSESDELTDAEEAARQLIILGGYVPTDTDSIGKEISDEVQTLLTLAMLRAKELRERLTNSGNAEGVYITTVRHHQYNQGGVLPTSPSDPRIGDQSVGDFF